MKYPAAVALLLAAACAPAAEPPGRNSIEGEALGLEAPEALATAPPETEEEPAVSRRVETEPGGGAKLASIAMRTWVYLAPTRRSKKIGYLRAGALVDRGAEPVGTDACPAGWFRIAPRGYVCVGKTASLDVAHAVVLAAAGGGPRRGEPFPYRYVISRRPPPTRYVRLPTGKEQRQVEGVGPEAGVSSWALRNGSLLGPADALTPFLESGADMPKPWGAEERWRFEVHRGRAKGDSAFGLTATFDWTGRRFGLTTELDLIPVDRTNVVVASAMRGIELAGEQGVPAFVVVEGVGKMVPDASGKLRQDGWAMRRSGWVLTGRTSGDRGELAETTQGVWLPVDALRVAKLGKDLWSYADRDKKWIDVSIERQILVAYEGTRPVYATLVSTGRGGLEDPETTSATVQGTFFITDKHLTATMDGDEASDDAFDLHDVPYVQYFHKGYALHGAYWHDAFGKVRSHGCVNLAPADAAWLFDWTDPAVPDGWHGAINPRSGTLVYIHP